MKSTRPLKHKNSKTLAYTLASIDVETDGLYGPFLACGFYCENARMVESTPQANGHNGYAVYTDIRECLLRVFAIAETLQLQREAPLLVLAHNLYNYDMHYFIDTLMSRVPVYSIEVIPQGDKAVGFVVKRDNTMIVRFQDTLPLFQTSLKKATQAFSPHAVKKDIGLARGMLFDVMQYEHREYLYYDCYGLVEAYKGFQAQIEDVFKSAISMTAGGTAMKAFLSLLPDDREHTYYRMSNEVDTYTRTSYYGGLVYPGHDMNEHTNVISLDLNAAYASVMRRAYPYGQAIRTTRERPGLMGIYTCYVTTPPLSHVSIPILPSRGTDGFLQWAYGRFTTTITSVEIAYARELGYTCEVIEGVIWKESAYMFTDFINLCEEIEVNEPEKKPAIKILRNSLYGKFGTRACVARMVIGDYEDIEKHSLIPVLDERGQDIPFLFTESEVIDAPYLMPHIASFVTAYQRITLHTAMMSLGHTNILYGDTDSIKVSASVFDAFMLQGPVLAVGERYGMWKVDGRYDTFQSFGPKNYRYQEKGTFVWKHKGIPMAPLLPYQGRNPTQEKLEVAYEQTNSVQRRMKNSRLPMTTHTKRTIASVYTSLNWIAHEDNTITPVYKDEDRR